MAQLLLEHGANPNIQLKLRPPYRNYIFDRGGDQILSVGATPLLRAAKAGDADAIRLLLKHEANVNLANSTGVTPTMAAAGMGHGANPTRGRFKTDSDGAAALELLIAAGGKVGDQAQDGSTALHTAAAHGWNESVKALVTAGAPLETLDREGLTPYDHAAGALRARVSLHGAQAVHRHHGAAQGLHRRSDGARSEGNPHRPAAPCARHRRQPGAHDRRAVKSQVPRRSAATRYPWQFQIRTSGVRPCDTCVPACRSRWHSRRPRYPW